MKNLGICSERDTREEHTGSKNIALRPVDLQPRDMVVPLGPIPLTGKEQVCLEECEEILRRGLRTFFEVGEALLKIRGARLYRENFGTFEAYCHGRWGIGRTYAWRLIGAAERLKLLPPGAHIPRPSNEFQIRPFLRLEADAFPEGWHQLVLRAKGRPITSELAKGIVAEIAEQKERSKSIQRGAKGANGATRRRKRIRTLNGCSVGQILILLGEVKCGIQASDAERAVSAIDRIEALVLGL